MSETEDDMTLDEYRGRVLRDAETHGRVVKLTGPQSVSDPSPHAHGVPVEGCVWCDLDTATAVRLPGHRVHAGPAVRRQAQRTPLARSGGDGMNTQHYPKEQQ